MHRAHDTSQRSSLGRPKIKRAQRVHKTKTQGNFMSVHLTNPFLTQHRAHDSSELKVWATDRWRTRRVCCGGCVCRHARAKHQRRHKQMAACAIHEQTHGRCWRTVSLAGPVTAWCVVVIDPTRSCACMQHEDQASFATACGAVRVR